VLNSCPRREHHPPCTLAQSQTGGRINAIDAKSFVEAPDLAKGSDIPQRPCLEHLLGQVHATLGSRWVAEISAGIGDDLHSDDTDAGVTHCNLDQLCDSCWCDARVLIHREQPFGPAINRQGKSLVEAAGDTRIPYVSKHLGSTRGHMRQDSIAGGGRGVIGHDDRQSGQVQVLDKRLEAIRLGAIRGYHSEHARHVSTVAAAYHAAMPAERDQRLDGIPRRAVGTLDYSVMPLSEAVTLVTGLGVTPPGRGIAIHFAPAYNVALADADPGYRDLLRRGDLVFSDGMPVVWAGRRLHQADAMRWTRVYGPDVMTGVLDASGAQGPAHYLLGGSPETLDALVQRIGQEWSQARIVGAESPPYREPSTEELAARDARIRASGATLVWVGLGTPKQDYEVRRLADAMPVTALGVGAAFDFLAGSVSQAPHWMQRSGLEWCYRLAREPRRLAGRYLWGNPRFLLSVGRQVARHRSP